MLEKLKKEAMRQGMKLFMNPKVAKMMADPRLMKAVMRGIELRGRIESEVDQGLRKIACALNLATREDVESLEQTLQSVQSQFANLAEQVHQDPERNPR